MRNIWLVLKHEIVTTLSKPSFWLFTFLFPAFILFLNLGTTLRTERAIGMAGEAEAAATTEIGYVDQAGLIEAIPPDIPAGLFRAYPTEGAAQDALASSELSLYLLIPEDYLQSGQVVVVQQEFSLFGMVVPQDLINHLLTYNLTGDPTLAAALAEPLYEVRSQSLAAQEAEPSGPATGLAYMVPYAALFIFFLLIVMSGGYMLQSVSREKENRTVEVLLVTLSPRQLMLGKVLGLVVVALLQMAVWMGGGMLLLAQGGSLLAGMGEYTLPGGFLPWSLLFFLLGYLMYASLMGAIGALAPSAREGGSLSFIVLLPLMIPVWLNAVLLNEPNGPFALALSLIPFTAPVAMVTRMAIAAVPLWQILASLAGLAVTAYLMVALAARFFRADTLLSTAPIQKERLLSVLRR